MCREVAYDILDIFTDPDVSCKDVVHFFMYGARCSSVVRVFAHGVMGRRIDPTWWTC